MASASEDIRAVNLPKEHACGPCLLLQAAVFGIAFGFLLQKGGVAKYELLLGVLLLRDFTVIKVMGSAILVGMIGVLTLHKFGWVKLHLKPTRYGANVIGGLIFGVGFALAGYCPGTGAAALGQGNFDAIPVIIGMMAGSYLFAVMSGWLSRTVNQWGERGEMRLPDLVRPPQNRVATGSIALLLLMALAGV